MIASHCLSAYACQETPNPKPAAMPRAPPEPATRNAVVLLSNTADAFAGDNSLDKLGFDLLIKHLAPPANDTQIANVWNEFAKGHFAFYISGPWQIGEFKRRLPANLQDAWMTAPLPGPAGPGHSIAGGCSLDWAQRIERCGLVGSDRRSHSTRLSGECAPRIDLGLDSPITQRIASRTLDLPQPFGPTIPVSPGSIRNSVGSTKDLKPASLRRWKCTAVSASPYRTWLAP